MLVSKTISYQPQALPLDQQRALQVQAELRVPPSRQAPQTERPVPETKAAEWASLMHRAREYGNEAAGDSSRHRRLADAYGALERHQEREYISRVLGVDEYA